MTDLTPGEYEDYVAEAMRQKFGDDAKIQRNVRLPSRSGVRDRQIDVMIDVSLPGLGEVRIVVDAKRYAAPVDAPDVEAFTGYVTDVGAKMGVLVTNTGFTEGAKSRAAVERGIHLDVVPIEELDDWEPPFLMCRACTPGLGEDSLPGGVWVDEPIDLQLDSDEWETVETIAGTCGRCGSAHISCPQCETLIVPAEWPEGEWIECEGGCGLSWYRRGVVTKDDLSAPEHALVTVRMPDPEEAVQADPPF
jgi:hypothetical protein